MKAGGLLCFIPAARAVSSHQQADMIPHFTNPQLRPRRAPFRIGTMTFTSIRHAHSHHGLTGRGALLRVHVRL